ncbi:hypothetical protein ILT44_04445 [Microvirga sp. BT689]|uniref:hypothetical protein n=1 Tax=Microvirga arvi TaxID=2778731 RepID=UPI00194FC0A9|nr:hypothetical protein [Microvirga arvi]MBM6579424.1 hypothetical protein [Microvirga arvi]
MQKQDWRAALVARHRHRFAVETAVRVPEGWRGLTEAMVREIDNALSPEERFVILSIHKARGQLAMISDGCLGTSTLAYRLYLAAVELSKHRCEVCGKSGDPVLVGNGTEIRCYEHREANDG